MIHETVTVSELTLSIKKQLESKFSFVSVRGEVSNCKEQSSGHIYFTLKDADAQISAVLFKGNAKLLKRLPKSGDLITLQGEITVYPPKGGYQILVRSVQYSGLGDLLLQLHERKMKLEAKGFFAPERKKRLPPYPKTIGVVTSSTGSVIQDIIHILSRRFSGFHLILNPVKVQGEGAAEEIASAIKQMNDLKLADVLIVGRGGGSLEDLWAFNEEKVAEAIFHSSIPIISAVGHETDHSICDLVADVRAPTPSAAAELVIKEKNLLTQNLFEIRKRLVQNLSYLCQNKRHLLSSITRQPFYQFPETLLEKFYQKMEEIPEKIDFFGRHSIQTRYLLVQSIQKQIEGCRPSSQVLALKQKLRVLEKGIHVRMHHSLEQRKSLLQSEILQKRLFLILQNLIDKKKTNFTRLISHLKGIDPKNLLTKGYCILFPEKSDSVILSSEQLVPEERIRILMHDGEATSTIQNVKTYERTSS